LVEAKVFEVGAEQAVHDLLVSYRSGDMWAPRVDQTEALQIETRHFLDCLASGEKPINDGRAGLRVVRMLEAADESLKRRREIVYAAAPR
jgi:predicted dehydrogenase